jgi:adenylate cyclase
MGVEIERKYLVVGDGWRQLAGPGRRFCQGHLARDGRGSVRVRRADDRAYITVKGPRDGITRAEFEYEIPIGDAEEMLTSLCAQPLIEKTRYCVQHLGVVWEIDVFGGDADGVVIAEVELASSDQSVPLPEWIGREVSHDPRYRNSMIVRRPEAALAAVE